MSKIEKNERLVIMMSGKDYNDEIQMYEIRPVLGSR